MDDRQRERIREGLRGDHEAQGTLWRDRLVERVQLLEHPAWGAGHFRRVAAMSERLAQADEPAADRDILSAVAWLHDVGTFPGYANEGVSPSDASAQAAEELLPGSGFPAEKVATVAGIIRAYSFDRTAGSSIEARIFHDAEALDFLGAIGLVRLLAIAGVEDWIPSPQRAVEVARRFADELPRKLVLPTAKRIAAARVAEADAFLHSLEVETQSLTAL